MQQLLSIWYVFYSSLVWKRYNKVGCQECGRSLGSFTLHVAEGLQEEAANVARNGIVYHVEGRCVI
jgi:hypothetical protein